MKKQFELGKTYELVDAKGFASSFDGNIVIGQEIIETGGFITVNKVQNGSAVQISYADGSRNEWASILGSEIRFFREVDEAIHRQPIFKDVLSDTVIGYCIVAGQDNYTDGCAL